MTTATLKAAMHSVLSIEIDELHESPWNPRKTFNAVKLQELADSLGRNGQITPCVVRKNRTGYEIAAGHRRFRAAQLAGLEQLLCVVRELDDAAFLEVLLIENADREDVHPLEEAQGFRTLMEEAGYDVAKIAGRVGRTPRYVHDRLKLLSMIPEAKAWFLADRFQLGHAVILAHLTPDQQAVALDLDNDGNERWGRNSGLFRRELGIFEPLDDDEDYALNADPDEEAAADREDRRTPVSVAEFQAWVDSTFRLDDRNEDLPMVFPETAQKLEGAAAQVAKVVHITYTHQVPPEIKTDGQKIIGPLSWKRADGQRGSETCEHAVLGLIVFGGGRGESFDVCIAKKKCPKHWPEHHRGKGKKGAKADGRRDAEIERERREVAKQEEAQRRDRELEERWKKAGPDLVAAIAERVKKLSAKSNGLLATVVIDHCKPRGYAERPHSALKLGSSAEDVVRYCAFQQLAEEATIWRARHDFPKRAKALGIDLASILAKHVPKLAKGKAAKRDS